MLTWRTSVVPTLDEGKVRFIAIANDVKSVFHPTSPSERVGVVSWPRMYILHPKSVYLLNV